jgi:hypothetical protein
MWLLPSVSPTAIPGKDWRTGEACRSWCSDQTAGRRCADQRVAKEDQIAVAARVLYESMLGGASQVQGG